MLKRDPAELANVASAYQQSLVDDIVEMLGYVQKTNIVIPHELSKDISELLKGLAAAHGDPKTRATDDQAAKRQQDVDNAASAVAAATEQLVANAQAEAERLKAAATAKERDMAPDAAPKAAETKSDD